MMPVRVTTKTDFWQEQWVEQSIDLKHNVTVQAIDLKKIKSIMDIKTSD